MRKRGQGNIGRVERGEKALETNAGLTVPLGCNEGQQPKISDCGKKKQKMKSNVL